MSFKLLQTFCGPEGTKRGACIVPASLCCMRFVNDGHHLHGDKVTDARNSAHTRENNLSFVQMFSADSASELKNVLIISDKALRSVDKFEELYVGCGFEYIFPEAGAL